MAREEHSQKCSSTSSCARGGGGGGCGGGGDVGSKRSSQRLKHKKTPQRGLGVAQLEKLRIEEQLKKEVASQKEDSDCRILFTNKTSPYDHLRQRSLLSCSSMVNGSSRMSPLSPVMNFQMEPPSNQSYYGNNYTPVCLQEEKTVLLKRQYPFPLEIPRASLPSTFQSLPKRLGESASSSNVLLPNDLQGTNSVTRGSSSSGLQLEPNSGRTISGNGCLDYGFLTLAPPALTPTTSEECLDDHVQLRKTSESSSGSSGQPPFFCFLPTPNLETGQMTTRESSSSREVGKTVDLNLKL